MPFFMLPKRQTWELMAGSFIDSATAFPGKRRGRHVMIAVCGDDPLAFLHESQQWPAAADHHPFMYGKTLR